MGEAVSLTSAKDGFAFGAYHARHEDARRGGLVLIQEIFGVTDHIRELADGFAADGYETIAPSLYDRQAHKFAGPCGKNSFLEDYVAEVRGKPIGCVVLASFNAAGKTQHVVASYRPRSSVVFFARLLAEKFAGTPIAKNFASES